MSENERVHPAGIRNVDLVDRDQLRHLAGADLAEHGVHRVDLRRRVGGRSVDDVDEEIGVHDLFERRSERLDELVREAAYEAHGVGEHCDLATGEP